jgi:hypothetical protein
MGDHVDEPSQADEIVEQLRMDERIRSFKPQVERPLPRTRPVFALALVMTMAFTIGVLVWDKWIRRQEPIEVTPGSVVLAPGCTPLEVEQVIRSESMTDLERVTCLAVAGKIDRARAMLNAMSAADRSQAINQVFNVAHPIADSGDDKSAGPIMELVVEFWPDNYMAVFHAGMAEFALGYDDVARPQLERFLTMYAAQDVWRSRAEQALTAIAAHAPLDQREAHFSE